MKSCGIIAEYNPFHNGHRFQLQEARDQSGADVMVVSMSGNFTQRGEPAIFDKWLRAETALQNGADLVLEQSVLGSVQSSDFFAKANVRLLQQVGCETLSFGAENGTSAEFDQLARSLYEQSEAINAQFRSFRNDGSTYADQMTRAIEATLGQPTIQIKEPNNQLALAYLKENLTFPRPMRPIAVKRMGAGHNERVVDFAKQASGTSLRSLLLAGKYANLAMWVPNSQVLEQAEPTDWEVYWPYLQYQLQLQTPDQLKNIYQMEEGIEFRLKKFVREAKSFAEFLQLVKNKRWTWVRLQRLCLYVLLGITREEVQQFFSRKQPVRVLGFTEKGRHYLNEIKKSDDEVVFITNVNKATAETLAVELRCDTIYSLGSAQEQNFKRLPIMIP